MRHPLSSPALLLWLLLLAVCSAAAQEETSKPILTPAEGEITPETRFTISFPDAMVTADKISAGDAAWPIVIEPHLEGQFLWQSLTEGYLKPAGRLVPGTHYQVSLAPSLRTARGTILAPQAWEFDSAPFTVSDSGDGEREALSALPRFDLVTNYPIQTLDAAKYIYFQDREAHERFPAEVLLNENQSAERETDFTVLPRKPLPLNRTFDLVIDGLRDAVGHKAARFPQLLPAGKTAPLEIEWLGAFNVPMEPAIIRAKFSEHVDPATITAESFAITPAVPGVKLRAEGDEVVAEGKFETTQRYVVTISPAVRGIRGYGLEKPSRWGATFHPKDSTIVFPGGEIFQRSARGLRFAFMQVNTGAATWTLSPVPLERLAEVATRVQEYKKAEPPMGFTPVGRGSFPASSGDTETLRQIAWQSPQPLSGPYLLEVTAPGSDGQVVGNRALISFSEYVLTQKRSASEVLLRVARMSDARPVPGLAVRAANGRNGDLATATTDAAGLAHFPLTSIFPGETTGSELFIVTTPTGPAIQYADSPTLTAGAEREAPAAVLARGLVITDRNLYRPGQTARFYGILRGETKGALTMLPEQKVIWKVKPNFSSNETATGEASLSGRGSWNGEWTIPAGLATGDYEISVRLDEARVASTLVRVEEYRVPLFTVEAKPVEKPGTVALLQVSSAYFHGAPNAGAPVRWTATWSEANAKEEDNFVRFDGYSEHHPEHSDDEVEAKGEAVLDAQGQVTIRCEPPYPDGRKPGRSYVNWRVEITSPEAQTQITSATAKVQAMPVWMGLHAEVKPGAKPVISVETSALDLQDQTVANGAGTIELFHVRAQTVKERIAPFITRFRNVREYEKVGTQKLPAPGTVEFPVSQTGEYVAVLTGPGDVLASTDLTLAGSDFAEMPVENETQIDLAVPQPARAYRPGETVPISVRAPFAGVAWVSIEAGEVLETMLVPLSGNAGRIDLPIKPEYAPNAVVSVYLLQPGGEKNLPRERIGALTLQVERPERAFSVETKFSAASFQPGQPVRADLLVQSAGKPVANAEFVVFAVDDAVLRLGEWSLPDPAKAFYPERAHTVSTFVALSRFVEEIKVKSLQQKGYVVGGGGEGMANTATRREFKTLAFWQSGLLTDALGKIHLEFPAPDNLTEYRLVAVGQAKAEQFGAGSATFQISKPLLCEPSLPRFTRIGDELQLRAVVRQTAAPKGKITVRCVTEGIELLETAPQSQTAEKGVPAVFSFKARVGDGSSGAKVRFEASSDFGESDAVEVSLPILPPSVLRRETVAFTTLGGSFQPGTKAPPAWAGGHGSVSVTLSTSPWLPKLAALPAVLEYPHGCFEQISARVLVYAMLPELLQSLPDASARDATYRETLEGELRRFEGGLRYDGTLPYWPEGEVADLFVTVQAAWAVQEAERAGLTVPPRLRAMLPRTLEKIVTGTTVTDPFTRCLALMVAARANQAKAYTAVAEELYLRRDTLGDEARAVLALAMQELGVLPREKAQLLKEFTKPPAPRAFKPDVFASTTRAEALTTLALARGEPGSPLLKARRESALALLQSSAGLSTQENLWLLLAFKALVEAKPAPALDVAAVQPAPAQIAKNRSAVAWPNGDLARLATQTITGLPSGTLLTGLLSASYRLEKPETERTDRGLRVERVTRNLTDLQRLGTAESPFRLGDQILITYRLVSRNRHFYLALEDLLPAGLETVNPNLPLISKTYQIPVPTEGSLLELSHSELRDQSTCLYFDSVEPGTSQYSVLARATTVGTFHWPATQAAPMYDARFTGLSTAGRCVVAP